MKFLIKPPNFRLELMKFSSKFNLKKHMFLIKMFILALKRPF